MAGIPDRARAWLRLAAVCLLATGCEPGPRAPVLRDEMVFHDPRLGLRFLVPEGWHTRSRAELPAGALDIERPIVEYARLGLPAAGMRVSAVDLAADRSIVGYLERTDLRKREFRAAQSLPSVDVGGVTAEAYVYAPVTTGPTREVIAVRRGERVYFLRAEYAADDTSARDAFRRAVASVVWE